METKNKKKPTQKMCELDETKVCNNCGECDRCDLDPNKICDNCGKCIKQLPTDDKGYYVIPAVFKKDVQASYEDLLKSYGLDDDDDKDQ